MSGVEDKGRPFPAPAEPAARAKVFTHGGSQAVRLPKAFRFDVDEVSVRKEGDTVVLEPVRPAKTPRTEEEWAAFWAGLDALTDGEIIELRPEDRILLHDPKSFDDA